MKKYPILGGAATLGTWRGSVKYFKVQRHIFGGEAAAATWWGGSKYLKAVLGRCPLKYSVLLLLQVLGLVLDLP